MLTGMTRDPNTGLDRWRVERAGTYQRSDGASGYGKGWFAINLRTGVGAYKPTQADALRFALAQVRDQAGRIGWTEDAITDYQDRKLALGRLRDFAGRAWRGAR